MSDKEKKSKSEVNYREAWGTHHCGNCSMYHALAKDRGGCDLVKGVVDYFDICDEWTNE